jgi:hypothetical protein
LGIKTANPTKKVNPASEGRSFGEVGEMMFTVFRADSRLDES